MDPSIGNCTGEFRLLSFSVSADVQIVFILGILFIYSLILLGNLVIIVLISLAPHLHTPMYYFLCNLSVQDIIYVSSILPKFLAITITKVLRITFPGCFTQMFFFTFCVGTEFLLLTSMAYDRYVAICIPLRYTAIMSKVTCVLLPVASWLVGFLTALIHSLMVSFASFCGSQDINHFYCDLKTVIKLASSDTTHIKTLLFVVCIVLGLFPFLLILTSYIFIISRIVKIRSSKGRMKAFSSCSSHLTVVILFYGAPLSSYMIPESEHSQEKDKLLSLLYTAVVPLLNPLVYSLRNNDVMSAMKKINEKYFRFPTVAGNINH
ncbi:olfactory receptor 5V1-like [Bufo bufo]|uniref:olfactory receptor 5V1-like n=1 Tax=Bufo bufo TaxID=8384 RepID=UPI001ABDC6EE|nr:olfactory receptor 5V1-like [Bufo bufo]